MQYNSIENFLFILYVTHPIFYKIIGLKITFNQYLSSSIDDGIPDLKSEYSQN